MKGLNEVHVAIEDFNEDAKNLGFTEEDLTSVTLVALKREIPNLKVSENGGAMFYVRVAGFKLSCGAVASSEVKLFRPVMILNDDGSNGAQTRANVWGKSWTNYTPHENIRDTVRESIREMVTEFAAEYYKQNNR